MTDGLPSFPPKDGTQAFNEIMQAVHQLRRAFIKNGMPAPLSIELADDRSVTWFRYALPAEMAMQQPRIADDPNRPQWVCNIMGVEVVMPGQWRSERGNGRRLV